MDTQTRNLSEFPLIMFENTSTVYHNTSSNILIDIDTPVWQLFLDYRWDFILNFILLRVKAVTFLKHQNLPLWFFTEQRYRVRFYCRDTLRNFLSLTVLTVNCHQIRMKKDGIFAESSKIRSNKLRSCTCTLVSSVICGNKPQTWLALLVYWHNLINEAQAQIHWCPPCHHPWDNICIYWRSFLSFPKFFLVGLANLPNLPKYR